MNHAGVNVISVIGTWIYACGNDKSSK